MYNRCLSSHYLCRTFISLTFFAKFVMLISTHRRYHLVCTVLHDASVAAPILWHIKIDFTTARWDFRSSQQSPPRISAFWWTFELQVSASSRPSSWQQSVLGYGKKVGWLLCFAMFFSAILFIYLEINANVLPSFATPPPWLLKPHAPCLTLTAASI
jgi:hypothetical protein